MHIYISTFHRGYNYGESLQSCAMQYFLKKISYDSELLSVNHKRPHKYSGKKAFIKSKIKDLYKLRYLSKDIMRKKNFENFFKKYHKVSQYYSSFEVLKQNPPKDGIYLAGSDQIFNPMLADIYPDLFLQFGKKETKRISYAASLGVNNIPPDKQDIFKKYISVFDKVSLRESTCKDEVERLYGREVAVNVDPCLLLSKEEWDKIRCDSISKKVKKAYILVYLLYRPSWINQFLKKLHNETGYDIILLTQKIGKSIYNNYYAYEAGPSEFLDLIANAKMVISSSFHGNVFSIIYQKPFYAIVNPNSASRITELLTLFKLENRILKKDDTVSFDIDYSKAEAILRTEQEKSKNYLINSIEGD